jgi:uncharacterized membrane protein YcaP (DUF421 family)
MLMNEMFFDSWESLLRTFVVGILAYIGLLLILRTTGKRTLSKLNAFDLVVTVALGSTLAACLLNKEVALAEGVLAFAVLCGLQYLVTWTSVRSNWIRNLVKSEPKLVVRHGEPIASALKSERLTLDEVQAAARAAQLSGIDQAEAIVLETDGTLSVIPSQVPHNLH